MKFCLTLAATVLLGGISLEAHAQQPSPADRRYSEGIGVRVGDLELHPGISGEVGYDSNYFLRAPSEEPVLSAFRLRVTPSITLATLGPQRRENNGSTPQGGSLIFRAGAFVSYNELIATDSQYSSTFADQRHLDAGANFMLNILPNSRVGGDTYGNFLRQVQPSNNLESISAFDRDTVRAGAGISWRPGGRLFEWRLGYEFNFNYFERSAFQYLNNFQNTINMRGRWRFLPRTALLYDGSYTWVNYPNPSPTQNNGTIANSRIGLNGLITTRFALLAMVGWAGTFYDAKAGQSQQQYDSLTAQAELKWFISGVADQMNAASAPVGLSYAAIGYMRDVNNSYLGNFFQRDRGYASVSYLLGGVLVTSLSAGLANLRFPTSYVGGTEQPPFSEQRVDATLFGEYRLSNTFGINATINYNQNITDMRIFADAMDQTGDALAYRQWQAFLGVRWFL